ncbi:hypothetical protein C8A03DRAFT_32645 [Achaetomium macrosporum]|uniref:Fucose-specific lectin n=1 Tax=Achaetomium macrosporum TaxID=79813 RepID=A0AAN7CD26_9PEZI|nr:hypothetical protein C8A03DRAFT_32645 [Achaetomium macrosporum]
MSSLRTNQTTSVSAVHELGGSAPWSEVVAYTKLHLSALAFVHPESRTHIKQCRCKAHAPPDTPATENRTSQKNQLVRIYHTEPSIYRYNEECYLVRETRYSSLQGHGWHAPSDDLVADDAVVGSAVSAVGWWADGGDNGEEAWETRVYYIDKTGKLRERANRTSFTPEVKDEFEHELPDPLQLVPPTPGWKLTPLSDAGSAADSGSSTAATTFPAVSPLRGSKLAAVRSEDGKVHVFYQARDHSLREMLFAPGAGWAAVEGEDRQVVAGSDSAKPGTSLTAVSGGWAEVRLFYVTPADKLAGVYADDHTRWTAIDIPAYTLPPTAMLAAVAWNYASPFFEMHIYTTDDKDDLYDLAFSRDSGGWAPAPRSVKKVPSASLSPARGSGAPLSAVTAIIVDDEWQTKVYFHPRRQIAVWDVCSADISCNGIPKTSEAAAERRRIEEETRVKIKEEEERKESLRRKAEERARREEEERLRREEEERNERLQQEAEEKARREEEERARQAKPVLPNSVTLRHPKAIMGALEGAPTNVDDEFRALDLPFAVTLYGYASTKLWVTDNGMLCLDQSTHARNNRTGKPLPSRENIPPYTMFPFWTDLMIVQGRPHGIYYEIVGEAPSRSITVEWYVTRYGNESQYFHFNLLLEEARPNVVTFKYYDAVDKGAECTIGVQGPTKHLMFSHNQPKVYKGLKLVFNTADNTVAETRFQP